MMNKFGDEYTQVVACSNAIGTACRVL